MIIFFYFNQIRQPLIQNTEYGSDDFFILNLIKYIDLIYNRNTFILLFFSIVLSLACHI